MKHLLLCAAILSGSYAALAQTNGVDTRQPFIEAKIELENMLDGKTPLSYERAVLIVENAYWQGRISDSIFNDVISSHVKNIQRIISAQSLTPPNSSNDLLESAQLSHAERRDYFRSAAINNAIFRYITDTCIIFDKGHLIYHLPYAYSASDPLGSIDWANTQVSHLLDSKQGNCYALASLYKIFAERLNSNAWLCTAPGHIYIRHADDKGVLYNVELSNGGSFPGTGTIETLTYSTSEAVRKNIALRDLDLRQSIALCLVYLAKGYQHKTNCRPDSFMMGCAEAALSQDSNCLSAMLLKKEVLEERLTSKGLDPLMQRNTEDFLALQTWLTKLFNLGYREMPLEMKNMLVKHWTRDTRVILFKKQHGAKAVDSRVKSTRNASLSWGLFDEEIRTKPIEQYGTALFDTRIKQVVGFSQGTGLYNNYDFDPVAFAWNVDPLAHKYPEMSPYHFAGNNPIYYLDADGRELVAFGSANQTRVLGYLSTQFGEGVFRFNRQGELTVNNRAFREASARFNDNQRTMADGVVRVINSRRIIEARTYPDNHIDFARNPIITENVSVQNRETGTVETVERSRPLYSGRGVVIPELDQEALTLSIPQDDRAFILMNFNTAESATYQSAGGTTNPCASCIFMHELLDHGQVYIETGTVPVNAETGVENHNRALENRSSPTRTGEDHR